VHAHAVFVALALILAPLAADAADLVVWWEKGYYDQEDEAVREIVAAFEQETGKQVDLVFQQQN
jgi:ABC-type glycerol-3-phosphate transport system substrate-binding protein